MMDKYITFKRKWIINVSFFYYPDLILSIKLRISASSLLLKIPLSRQIFLKDIAKKLEDILGL